ncbi:MAG: acyltransferase [Calditrichaceae bacterium]|nr:acyltransferase [Calditrichia bacterium]NUQ42879.1 acyltransferase [Calditrichaceae bacterium]
MLKKIIVYGYIFFNKITSLPVYLMFRIWKVQYGKNLTVAGFPVIQKNKKARLILGDRVKLISTPRANLVGLTNRCTLVCNGPDSEIVVGDDSGLSGVVINARESIKIGKHVMLGGNVRIFDHDFHQIHYQDRRDGTGEIKSRPVVIEDDVFIGTNSIILKGTRIGRGSVIGAGSVVSGNVPAGEIWAGNPARKVRSL